MIYHIYMLGWLTVFLLLVAFFFFMTIKRGD